MRSFYETLADSNDYFFVHEFHSQPVSPHFHKSLEFVYCLDGKTEFFAGGEKFVLEKDEIYTVPSYFVHSNRNLGENRTLSFLFAESYFDDFEKTYPNMTFDFVLRDKQTNQRLKPLFENLLALYMEYGQKQENIPFLKRRAVINDFLYVLTKAYPLHSIPKPKAEDRILDVLTFLNEHYAEPIDLPTLSKRYGYSPQHFSELFNTRVGCNLKAYINNVRIEKALALMADKNESRSITQIAFDCGFNSLATFYRALKTKRQAI